MGRRLPPEPPIDLDAACAERGCKRPHRHGESRTEGTHGCPCQPCRSARWHREKRRQHAHHRGTAEPQYGPADGVRGHLATLTETGATLGAIAAAAGVHRDTLSRLVRDDTRKVQPAVGRRILAVRPSDVDDLGTSVGAHRRLQALAALGWSSAQIADAAGMHPRVVLKYTGDDAPIRTPARRLIVAAYHRLWDKQPPIDTTGQKAAATYARNRAATNGWAPPMAWDDIDHDDAPQTGEQAKTRTGPAGIHPDDIGLMLSTCATTWEAADRLGITRDGLLRGIRRHEIELPPHIRVRDAERGYESTTGRMAA